MLSIQSRSRYFRILFQGLLILQLAMLFTFWIIGAKTIEVGYLKMIFLPTNFEIAIPTHLSWQTRLLGLLASCIPYGIYSAMLYCLIQLFKLYEQAKFFLAENVRYIKNIGYLLLASTLVQPIYEMIISFIFSLASSHGSYSATASFSGSNLFIIVISLIIILIASVMEVGCKINEENSYTV